MIRFYSHILRKVILQLADNLMSTRIMYYYSLIIKMNNWSKTEIESWQNNKLQKLVKFSYNNTEYYKELFDRNNIDPNMIRTQQDLAKIPILTKETIIANYKKLIPTNIGIIKHKVSSTGGSTGDPMKYLLDIKSWSFSNANNMINWERTSYKYGDKFIALGSTSININKKTSLKHKLYYRLKNKISLNGINMSDEVCANYLIKIIKENIKYIYGYASAIYLLAKYAKTHHIKTPIEACFPTSEILTPLYRETIRTTFNCEVVNCYGAHDGGVTAFEHLEGNFEVGYNCIIHTNSSIKREAAPALLTDLLNFAMPLINYQLGDEVILADEENNNYSYNGQVISEVLGRTSDIIKLDNGRMLTGPGFTILFKDLPVAAYSIKYIYGNTLICQIKKMKDFCIKDEELIYKSLKKQAGIESEIVIEYVNEFKLLKSGKRQYFISE